MYKGQKEFRAESDQPCLPEGEKGGQWNFSRNTERGIAPPFPQKNRICSCTQQHPILHALEYEIVRTIVYNGWECMCTRMHVYVHAHISTRELYHCPLRVWILLPAVDIMCNYLAANTSPNHKDRFHKNYLVKKYNLYIKICLKDIYAHSLIWRSPDMK